MIYLYIYYIGSYMYIYIYLYIINTFQNSTHGGRGGRLRAAENISDTSTFRSYLHTDQSKLKPCLYSGLSTLCEERSELSNAVLGVREEMRLDLLPRLHILAQLEQLLLCVEDLLRELVIAQLVGVVDGGQRHPQIATHCDCWARSRRGDRQARGLRCGENDDEEPGQHRRGTREERFRVLPAPRFVLVCRPSSLSVYEISHS